MAFAAAFNEHVVKPVDLSNLERLLASEPSSPTALTA